MSRPLLRPGAALAACLSLTSPALADPPDIAADTVLPEITVSAARRPVPRTEIGSSVTVIPAEEIEQRQRRTVPDLLQNVPGLNVVQTNGTGGQTSVFIRGANANHTKVRIDGMEANDPSSPTGAFDFGPLLTTGIARIEVLRGPQSGLYGADAIGGVIDITTPRGNGPARVGGSLEGGSFGTFNQTGYLRGSTGPFNYSLDVGHYRSTDTQVTPEQLVPPGRRRQGNLFDNTTVATRLGYDVTENFDVTLTARLVESQLRFVGDDFSTFPSTIASEHSTDTQRQLFTRVAGHLVLFGGVLEQTVGVGYTDYRRRDAGPDLNGIPAVPTLNRGDRVKLDWRGDVRLGGLGTLVLGAEHQLEELRDSPISARTTTNAGFVELIARAGRLTGAASVRFDSNSRFGDYATWRVAPAFNIPETGTVLKASAGTGFKGPTLNQLFVNYSFFSGNPNLKAEESIGYDAGFEQTFGPRVRVGATYYHNDFDNLITTNATFTSYANIAKASTHGVEAFAAWQVTPALNVRTEYTYTIAQDDVLNQELLRRPRHKLSADGGWQVTDRFFLSTTLLYVSSRVDGNRDFSVFRQRANGFFTANVAANYRVTDTVSLFGRIDNLLDRTYENPSGFLQPGIGAYGGVRFGL